MEFGSGFCVLQKNSRVNLFIILVAANCLFVFGIIFLRFSLVWYKSGGENRLAERLLVYDFYFSIFCDGFTYVLGVVQHKQGLCVAGGVRWNFSEMVKSFRSHEHFIVAFGGNADNKTKIAKF